ncbi:uncharacterized protein [Halyomorpha halys]|uniref:uncharacterized protein isoform X2 n=1 Tax=Halyomorpha halys TaxID=286706 RepID=UPI0006D4F943|nr:RNA-binding protein FUS-like isoform X2 [Halyomorpha halys]
MMMKAVSTERNQLQTSWIIMERRGGRGGPSRGGSRGRGSSFGDRGGGGSRGRGGFSRGGRGGSMGRSESRFSRDERSDRPPFEGRGGGRGGPRGRGGFSRDFRGGGRSGDRDFRGGRMDRGGGMRGNRGKRPASGPPQMGKRPRYEGGSSYPDANGPYQSYERNPPAQSSYPTQVPYRGAGSGGYGGGDAGAYGSSGGYGSGGYMSSSGYDSAGGDYAGYSAPPPPASDHYGDSYKSKHYEGSSSGYGQSREYSSQPRSRY